MIDVEIISIIRQAERDARKTRESRCQKRTEIDSQFRGLPADSSEKAGMSCRNAREAWRDRRMSLQGMDRGVTEYMR